MIYLLITLAGAVLICAGLYSMSFGFSSPPNFLLFLIGLISLVLGAMIVILFVGKIDLASLRAPKPKAGASPARDKPKMKMRPEPAKKAAEPVKKPRFRKPVKPAKQAKQAKPVKPVKSVKPVKATKAEPKKKEKISKPMAKVEPKAKKEKMVPKKPTKVEEEKPSKTRRMFRLPKRGKKEPEKTPAEVPAAASVKDKGIEAEKEDKVADKVSKPIAPKRVPRKLPAEKPVESAMAPVKDSAKESAAVPSQPAKDMKPIKPVKLDKSDKHYVKDRLNKLKQEYIENVDDVEDLLEERMDSFKGALNQIRSESRAPSIIWSFDATDVQEAMKETILSADNKVIMMYPWIRNVDVGILKKFMDVESRMIIQEASLDDDASVELIKVLVENNVKIRTMPHIHTVAVVSDENHGLIISTDPIYESYEVGVIYKDEKSISEIEKLFEEAWGLSREVDLGGAS